MDQLQGSINEFIEKIQTSNIYVRYQREKDRVKKHPSLKEEIDQYRKESFALQSQFEGDELLKQMEAFEKKYEDFVSNPLILDFLEAETALVRMFQDIMGQVTDGLNFE